MNLTKKRMFKYIRTDDVGEFKVIKVTHSNGCPLNVTLKDVNIPFGTNKDNSLKFDVLQFDDVNTNKGFTIMEKLQSECVKEMSHLLHSDQLELSRPFLAQKKHFVPNITGHLQYRNKHITTVIEKKQGLPVCAHELKGYRASVELFFDYFWVKNGVAFGKWKISSIRLKT